MTAIAKPDDIFATEEANFAADVAECLLEFEGCSFRRWYFVGPKYTTRDFKTAVCKVNLQPTVDIVASRFANLIRKHWTYTADYKAEKFVPVDEWRSTTKNLVQTLDELVPK